MLKRVRGGWLNLYSICSFGPAMCAGPAKKSGRGCRPLRFALLDLFCLRELALGHPVHDFVGKWFHCRFKVSNQLAVLINKIFLEVP